MATQSQVSALATKIANAKRYISNETASGHSVTAAGASETLADYEAQLEIAQAERYISEQEAKGNTENVAGAQGTLDEYEANYQEAFGDPAPAADEEVVEEEEEVKTEEATGNTAVDSSNILSNILNSPLYTEAIKNAYLESYLPGLTQANYNVNAKRAAEVQNSVMRQQAQRRAVRSVAGDYAARGLRTPKMITEGIEPIQQATERAKTTAQQEISGLEKTKELSFGISPGDESSFISNPAAFGAIGAQARRAAVGGLQSLPGNYGLTQVEKTASAPKELLEEDKPAQTGPTAAELNSKIAAGNRYLSSQVAKGNEKTIAGATRKIKTYTDQLAALG